MSRLPRPRPQGLLWGACVLAALAGVLPAAGALAAGPPAPGQEMLSPPGAARAEIRFPAPVRYAVILQESGQVRTLYARGDIVFHPQDPWRALAVLRVEPEALIVREGPRGQVEVLPPGRLLPGFPGWVFTGTVLLDQLHYRYKVVNRLRHLDPVVVALGGTRAVLEVEVLQSPAPAPGDPSPGGSLAPQPTPPARATLDGSLLEKVQMKEVSPGRYEVPAADVQAVLENAGQVLADLWPSVQPSLSYTTGLQYQITSAAGDGVLSGQGFTVTAPKLAERAGIQVGDTILRVNGQPVDGVASLYAIFQAVRRDPALRTVQVELERRGSRLTKTYRIR